MSPVTPSITVRYYRGKRLVFDQNRLLIAFVFEPQTIQHYYNVWSCSCYEPHFFTLVNENVDQRFDDEWPSTFLDIFQSKPDGRFFCHRHRPVGYTGPSIISPPIAKNLAADYATCAIAVPNGRTHQPLPFQ